jgi:hypothetical protein
MHVPRESVAWNDVGLRTVDWRPKERVRFLMPLSKGMIAIRLELV